MCLLKVVSVVTLDNCFSIIMSFAVLLSLFQNTWVLDRSDVCNDQVDVRYAPRAMDMLSPAGFVCQPYLFVFFVVLLSMCCLQSPICIECSCLSSFVKTKSSHSHDPPHG
jgi:hypothetical protein